MESNGARIFVVDDHPAVRQGVTALLTVDSHIVCGEAGCKQDLLQTLNQTLPQLVLLDLSLGEDDGLQLISWILQQQVPVLAYTMHEEVPVIESCFRHGALGYVSKREDPQILLDGVREVLAGRRFISPRGAHALAVRVLSPNCMELTGRLSEREQQIMDMLGAGCSNADIARKLTISVRTVESYCTRIMEKLQLTGMKELRRQAIQGRS